MKKFVLFLMVSIAITASTNAQIFDSLGVISPGYEIEDLCSRGNTLYAAMGAAGVWNSNDDGATWTATSPLPDAGFGEEWAFCIHAASNGDLIVGGNTVYNNAPFSGAVFRSSDDGASWTAEPFTGLLGYEESRKIVELSNGDLMLLGGQDKLFSSSLSSSEWIQTNAPGGVIFGFEQINDEIFVVTNPSAGNAGTWTSTDLGASWERYGSNGTPIGTGTVTLAPIIRSGNYKFIGIGGTSDPRGMYRSGVNDTLWLEKNNGLGDSGIYPTCMATDGVSIWMVMQGIDNCMFTSTADYGENWETPAEGLPMEGGSNPCLEKMVVHGTDLYTYANESVFRMEDVAVPTSVDEALVYDSGFSVYPNPATQEVYVSFKNIQNLSDQIEINIIDVSGKLVYQNKYANQLEALKVDLSIFKSGFYMISVNIGQSNYMQKLVIRK